MEAYVQAWVPHERGMRGQRSGVGWVGGWVGGGKGTTSETWPPPPHLVVLALGDPHLLEGGERGEDGAADPDAAGGAGGAVTNQARPVSTQLILHLLRPISWVCSPGAPCPHPFSPFSHTEPCPSAACCMPSALPYFCPEAARLHYRSKPRYHSLAPHLYLRSGGATTLIFMDEGASAVISLVMRSAMPGNMVVPPAHGAGRARGRRR